MNADAHRHQNTPSPPPPHLSHIHFSILNIYTLGIQTVAAGLYCAVRGHIYKLHMYYTGARGSAVG